MLDALVGTGAFGDQGVETSGTLCRRSAGVVKELRANLHLSLSIAFSGIEQRRESGSVQVVTSLCNPPHLRLWRGAQLHHQFRRPCNKLKFNLVDIKSFVIQFRMHGDTPPFSSRSEDEDDDEDEDE